MDPPAVDSLLPGVLQCVRRQHWREKAGVLYGRPGLKVNEVAIRQFGCGLYDIIYAKHFRGGEYWHGRGGGGGGGGWCGDCCCVFTIATTTMLFFFLSQIRIILLLEMLFVSL